MGSKRERGERREMIVSIICTFAAGVHAYLAFSRARMDVKIFDAIGFTPPDLIKKCLSTLFCLYQTTTKKGYVGIERDEGET